MPSNYTILWRTVPRSVRQRDGLKHLGIDLPLGERERPRISTQTLDEKAAAEAAMSPEVELIAADMKTSLIRPLFDAGAGGGPAWGVGAVGADTSGFTGAGTKIAILDTGIEATHPAFASMSLVEQDFSGTGDGDRNGHGTHCAGTIFGRDVAGQRIGIARGIDRAFVGKVLRDDGSGTSSMIFDGFNWAIQQQCDIISMSIGFDFAGEVKEKIEAGWPADLSTSEALEKFFQNLKMFQALMGVAAIGGPFRTIPLVVAAAGNESRREVDPNYRIGASLPAAVSDVSVGAVQRVADRFSVADFSNSNPQLVAPGVSITSAAIGGGLRTLSGTSMACPHVAGAAALWAESIRASGDQVSALTLSSHLLATARRQGVPGLDTANIADVGRGLVSAPQ